MSNIAKVSGALPADDNRNGLDAQVNALLNEPHELRTALVVYRTVKVTEDVETGVKVPTIGFTRFEPICRLDELPEDLKQRILDAAAKRTGREALPLDTVEVVDE